MKKVFFLDRDGVIVEEENYLADPAKARLCRGCAAAFRKIAAAGYGIVVTSNQSGIARGYFTMTEVKAVERQIERLLLEEGSPVLPDGWYYCPHHRKGVVPEFSKECSCRKPKPGLLLQAARELGIDCGESFMIGDKLSDLEAAFAAGCRGACLVMTGHGAEQERKPLSRPYETASGIEEAVDSLLREAK